jgi:hypothetical protein
MSTKTLRKRISLVAVTALTAGVLSVVVAPAASANIAATPAIIAVNTGVNVATGTNDTGAAIVAMTGTAADTAPNTARSLGLLYKDASSTTAQTATVLNTGALVLYTLSNVASTTNIAFVASGGAFGTTVGDSNVNAVSATATFSADRSTALASVTASTAVAVSWSTSTVGTYTISVYRSSATANIAGLTDTTDGDLIGGITVTVVSSATAATTSAISVPFSTCVTDNQSGAITSTADSTATPTNGSPWYIKWILRNGFAASNTTPGNIVATATNGALISISNGTQAAGTTSTAVGYGTGAVDDFDTIRVDQPTAGVPLTTTVTIQFNGVTVCTKTVTIRGATDKMIISNVGAVDLSGSDKNDNWLGQGSDTYAGHYNVLLTDSAGNVTTPTATTEFSIRAATATTTVTGLSVVSVATSISSTSTHRFSVGRFTCGPTAGSSTVTLDYTNASTGKITSASFVARCADDPATYTASFDKASYRQGEIATLTLKFLDSKGNPANSMDPVGASSIILPMMTMVSATGAATATTDANGEIKYTLTVGTATGMTSGTYTGIVDFTALTAATATKQLPTYTVSTGGDTTTNADVLKSIVALIASINKQIQALQKLILKR